jgi:hypothetical protein
MDEHSKDPFQSSHYEQQFNAELIEDAKNLTQEDVKYLEQELILLEKLNCSDLLEKEDKDALDRYAKEKNAILNEYRTMQCASRQTLATEVNQQCNISISERIENVIGSSIIALMQLSCLLRSAMLDKSNSDDDLYKIIVEKIFESTDTKITFATKLFSPDEFQIRWVDILAYPLYCDRGKLSSRIWEYYHITQNNKPIKIFRLWKGEWKDEWDFPSKSALIMSTYSHQPTGDMNLPSLSQLLSGRKFGIIHKKIASFNEIEFFIQRFSMILSKDGFRDFTQDNLLEILKNRYYESYIDSYRNMVIIIANYIVSSSIACTWKFFGEFLFYHLDADYCELIYELFKLTDVNTFPQEGFDVNSRLYRSHYDEYTVYLLHMNVYRLDGHPYPIPVAIHISHEKYKLCISFSLSEVIGISVNNPDPKNLCFFKLVTKRIDPNFDGYPYRKAWYGYGPYSEAPKSPGKSKIFKGNLDAALPWHDKDKECISELFDLAQKLSEASDPFAYGFDARFFRLFPFRYFPFVPTMTIMMRINHYGLGKVKIDEKHSIKIPFLPVEVMSIIFNYLPLC